MSQCTSSASDMGTTALTLPLGRDAAPPPHIKETVNGWVHDVPEPERDLARCYTLFCRPELALRPEVLIRGPAPARVEPVRRWGLDCSRCSGLPAAEQAACAPQRVQIVN